MKGARTLFCITALTLVICIASGAQVLPGRVSSGGVGQTPLSLTTTNTGTFGTTSDLMFGTGAVGPYNASYKPVNRFSETVTVDGKIQQRDFDYTIDYASGAITFKKTVGTSSAIRIEYSYDPSKATSNKAPLSLPVSLQLAKKQGAGLQFTGLYRQGDRNVKNASDLVVYGLTGDSKLGTAGQLISMFLFNPDVSNQANSGGFSDRSALKLGGTTSGNGFQLNTSYLRVGEQFAGAKDYNLQQGIEAMDVSASYAAGKSMNLTSSYNKTEALAGEKKGETVSTMQQKVVLTPTGAPKMTLTHTQVDKDKPNTIGTATTTDSVLLEHKLSPKMSATATRDSVTTKVGSAESTLITNQLVLASKPSESLSITSRMTQKDSSTDGGQLGYGMDIAANPTKTMSLNASMSRLDTDKTGQSGAESISLLSDPKNLLNSDKKVTAPGLAYQGSFAHSTSDAAGDSSVHALRIVGAPRLDWRFELGLTGKNVSAPQDGFARAFLLSTTAVRNTQLQYNFLQNESDARGIEDIQGVRLVSTPFSAMTVSGGFSQRQTSSVLDISKEATVEVKPFTGTTVSGAYRETASNGTLTSKVQSVNASTKPAKFIQLSGGFKNRENIGQENLNSVNAAVQVDAGGKVSLTGSYAENPEDQKGVVQRVYAQSVGLRTDFGSIRVKGGYTLKDEYLLGRKGLQTDIGLDYRLSKNSLLTTNYTMDERQDTSILQTHVYSLGYTHSVGSSLNLYLTGRMTLYEKDRTMLQDQTDYEAEARLGMKF